LEIEIEYIHLSKHRLHFGLIQLQSEKQQVAKRHQKKALTALKSCKRKTRFRGRKKLMFAFYFR
jgi:hypothetical protein